MNTFVNLKNGLKIPKLGMGMWSIGDNQQNKNEECMAICKGIESGMTLIDTAEMYGNGKSESVVGEAIKNFRRDELFLISKVLPQNAKKNRIKKSLEASLRRLQTDYLDSYLYHWIGHVPFEEVIEGMENLVKDGLIRSWGVSNFDTLELKTFIETCGGKNCVLNQVLYHVGSRGIEYDLLPYMEKNNVIPMSYCPLAQGGRLCSKLLSNETLMEIAHNHNISVMQVLLAFVLRYEHMIAIPKSSSVKHTMENAAVCTITLSSDEISAIDCEFPAPKHKVPLDLQ